MPTPIIERRVKDPPCCGGSFIQNQLILGRGSSPCSDIGFNVLSLDVSTFFPTAWTQGGTGTSIGSGKLVVPEDPEGDDGINDYWTATIPVIDQGIDHVLSFDKVQGMNLFSNAVSAMTIQTATHYVDITGLDLIPTGAYSQPLPSSGWIAGNSPNWAVFSVTPIPNTILFTFATFGLPVDEMQFDNISIAYEDCVFPCVETETQKIVDGGFPDDTNWQYAEITDPADRGLNITGGELVGAFSTNPAQNLYWQSFSINPDKDYVLSFNFYPDSGAPSGSFASIELWANDRYYLIQIESLLTGLHTYNISHADWIAGDTTTQTNYGLTAQTGIGLSYTYNSFVDPAWDLIVDNVSLIEQDCVYS